MLSPMSSYTSPLRHIVCHGQKTKDRTGVGTLRTFGERMVFHHRDGFPLLTHKKLHVKSIVHELLWFLSGSTNVSYLRKNGVTIWDEWADEKGDLGPVYGKQWRDFGGVDQLAQVVESLKRDPFSRRHVVSAWNPPEVDAMALPPCHCLFQFSVRKPTLEEASWSGYMLGEDPLVLDLQLYQRSADMFLGVPFNIASYALLQAMVAHVCGYVPGTFIHVLGDAHIYSNHLPQVSELLSRDGSAPPLPRLVLNPLVKDLFSFGYSDIVFNGYSPLGAIKAQVAV